MPPRLAPLSLSLLFLAGCSASAGKGSAPATKRTQSSAAPATSRKANADVSALTARAEKTFTAGDYAATAALAEQALAAEPDARVPLRLLAFASQGLALSTPRPENGPWLLKSAEAMRKLRKRYPDLTIPEKRDLGPILYNEACTLALRGESAQAIQSLLDAVDAGFRRPDYIDLDPDLNSLHKYPAYLDLVRRLELQDAAATLANRPDFSFDFHLNDLDDKSLALSDLKGKVVVVSFWGTWSLPSRKEIPHLVELSRRHQAQGLAVVAIAYEGDLDASSPKALRAYVNELGITFPCLIGDDPTRQQIPRFEGYPTTLLLDRQSKPRLVLAGYQPLSTLDALVVTLLNEGVKDTPKTPTTPRSP